MPRRKNIKGLKQYSNDNNLQRATSSQRSYQRVDKRSVNQDCCPAASATTTSNDVVITASQHQQSDSIEFCPPSLQWQHEQCQRLAYNVQPRPVQYTKQHRLSGNDLAIRDVRGDGNCLFRALALVVTGNEDNHMLVRQGLVAYMRQHRNSVKHTELYYITGGSARGKKVKPKTWRISAFADARLTPYGSFGSWYFPLTRLIFEKGSTFAPPWF